MSLKNQVVVIFASYFISLIYIRGFLYGIKRYQLNNSAYKKRKTGETFKEWLLYSKYREEIPKILRVLYYSVLIIHPIGLIVCLFAHVITIPFDIGGILAVDIAAFDCVWILVIALFFWSPGPGFAYERWITKRRGQKRNKK